MGWKHGDLACCINDDWQAQIHRLIESPPVLGEIRRVTGCRTIGIFLPRPFLCFGTDVWYYAPYFRKIVQDHSACDVGFKALIKRVTRQPEPV